MAAGYSFLEAEIYFFTLAAYGAPFRIGSTSALTVYIELNYEFIHMVDNTVQE